MLKIKTTFNLSSSEIDPKTKNIIKNKFVEQLAKCILANITEAPIQAEENQICENEGIERGIDFPKNIRYNPLNKMERRGKNG